MSVSDSLKAILEKEGPGKEGLAKGAKAVSEVIAQALKVKTEEVAILLLTSTGQTLKFVWPPQLATSQAAFPVTHKTAIASTVLASMKGKVDNKLAESKHLKFFENVKGMETSKLPIQKMVALPLFVGSQKLGVVEVSRKGRTPEEAGPNFSPQDAQALVGICKECAPLLAQLLPQPFL
jgi:hypothetical protein